MGIRIVSGGQTGVDRAALDAAKALAIPTGGWCPRGRRAEDGQIPALYPLRETPTAGYARRTEWNVRDSDATLVLRRGVVRGGTALASKLARRLGRPLLVVDLSRGPDPQRVRSWMRRNGVRVLNVAGPRQSESPGVHGRALRFLSKVLRGPGRPGAAPRLSAGSGRAAGRRPASGRSRNRARP